MMWSLANNYCGYVTVLLAAAVTYGCKSSCSAFGPGAPFTRRIHSDHRRNNNDIIHPHHYFHRFENSRCLLECSSGGDGGDENDPETWTSDTKPFTAFRFFARDDVTDQEIRKVLFDNAILTMEDLMENNSVAVPLLGKDIFPFIDAVKSACTRNKISMKQVLGGQFVYDTNCIPQRCFNMYASKAVAVKPVESPYKPDDRIPDFSLVLGSSGSGKTMFALKGLTSILYDRDPKAYFCVHFKAGKALGLVTESLTFPEAVAKIVQEEISRKLKAAKKVLSNDGEREVDLYLHVVLDEAGTEADKDYFDTAAKIQSIVDAIKNTAEPKFTRGVHVTVAGTALETTTAEILSVKQAVKFRMQQWQARNFDALVDVSSSHSQPSLVKQVVHSFPILEDVATNARCAFFLLRSMDDESFLRKSRLNSFVKVLISNVADSYIKNNSLNNLESVEQKWLVVRSVFRELDKATEQPGVPFFPQFEDLAGDDQLRSVAQCLLDGHVEYIDGKPHFVPGSRYSISISPALVLVLVNLLNTENDVSWDWQAFESMVMLSELKEVIVQSQDIPKSLDRLVVELPSPVPENTSATSFTIPAVGKHSVVLNWPGADYANVIAPFRLVATTFLTDDSKPAALDIQSELDKMGLTTAPNHVLQRYVTKAFYTLWTSPNAINAHVVVSSMTQTANKNHRLKCYPVSTLNSRRIEETSTVVVGSIEKDVLILQGETISRLGLCKEFEQKAVTAVFATNCKAFRLESKNVTIDHNDVDWEGKLKVCLPDGVVSGLQENVELRFLFF
jgi:hypothetical protein